MTGHTMQTICAPQLHATLNGPYLEWEVPLPPLHCIRRQSWRREEEPRDLQQQWEREMEEVVPRAGLVGGREALTPWGLDIANGPPV